VEFVFPFFCAICSHLRALRVVVSTIRVQKNISVISVLSV